MASGKHAIGNLQFVIFKVSRTLGTSQTFACSYFTNYQLQIINRALPVLVPPCTSMSLAGSSRQVLTFINILCPFYADFTGLSVQ